MSTDVRAVTGSPCRATLGQAVSSRTSVAPTPASLRMRVSESKPEAGALGLGLCKAVVPGRANQL